VAALAEEVLLEGQFHEVGLGSGDKHAVFAGRQHVVGQDDHAVVACIHDTYRGDLAELLVGARFLASDLGRDVLGRHVGLLFGGEAGLGGADWV